MDRRRPPARPADAAEMAAVRAPVRDKPPADDRDERGGEAVTRGPREKRGVPEGLWLKCGGCNATIYRKEAEEFSSLLNQVINVEGVPASHVAKLIGITHGAIQFRLVRYGYASTSGKSKAYQTIHSANRAIGGRNQNERII